MAPSISRSDRATRASTRSQTAKSEADTQIRKTPAHSKGGKRVNKSPEKVSSKVKKPSKTKAKPSPNPKSDRLDDAIKEATNPDPSTSPPSNATALTITDSQVKSPIICHQYTPSTPSTNHLPLVFTHGAGGTLSVPSMLHFCNGFSSVSSRSLLAFQGSMNLGSRVQGFHACYAHVVKHASDNAEKGMLFGGRSMGARAAVIAATEIASSEGVGDVRVVLVSYPLQGPKDVRDGILYDLPEGCEVLFIIGEKDAMCPLELLEGVRRKMKAVSRVVVVRGADHGMNVKPASKMRRLGEETGRLAARWSAGEIEKKGEALYVGDEA